MKPGFLRRWYFRMESKRLHQYQLNFDNSRTSLFMSTTDELRLKEMYGWMHTDFIPCFLPWQHPEILPGQGEYCLYQGNLSVSENIRAVEWLIKEVFKGREWPLLIAGKNAPAGLKRLIEQQPHMKLIENPDDQQMEELIRNAQVNVLPSFNETGVKLKLLHALFRGRFVITNQMGVAGSGLTKGYILAETAMEFRKAIEEVIFRPVEETDMEQRKQDLALYDNQKNAARLSELL
jgi:hypothetical protein